MKEGIKMNIISRSFINIKRRFRASIATFLIINILSSVVAGALLIINSVNLTEENLRNRMRPIVTIDLDADELSHAVDRGELDTWELLTLEQLRNITILPQVASYNYSILTQLFSSDLLTRVPNRFIVVNNVEMPQTHLTFHGTAMSEPIEMLENKVQLLTGSTFTQDHLFNTSDIFPVLISDELSQVNNLYLGSTFSLDNTYYRPILDGDSYRELTEENIFAQKTFTFEVVGIFDVVIPEDFDMQNHYEWQTINRIEALSTRIFLPNYAAEKMQRFELDTQFAIDTLYFGAPDNPFGENPQLFQTLITLKNSLEIESFITEAANYLPPFWFIEDFSSGHLPLNNAMNVIMDLMNGVFISAIITSAIIVILLFSLLIKSRRTEIGIFLALGEKRIKVISQLLFETFLISVFSIFTALLIGNFAANYISEILITNELNNTTNYHHPHMIASGINVFHELGLTEEMTIYEMQQVFDITLNIEVAMIFTGLTLLIILIANVIPLIGILQLKPKKILL